MKPNNDFGSEMYGPVFNSNKKVPCANKQTVMEEKTMKKAISHYASLGRLVILFVVVAICSAAMLLNGMGAFLAGSPSAQLPVKHNSQTFEPVNQVNQGQTDSSDFPNLHGEEAIELRKKGLFSSFAEAMTAAQYKVYPDVGQYLDQVRNCNSAASPMTSLPRIAFVDSVHEGGS